MSNLAKEIGNPFFMLCDKTSVSQIVDQQRSFITVSNTDSIIAVIKTLTSHKISSCPVLDSATDKCLGSIDFLSIINFTKDHIHLDQTTTTISQVMTHSNNNLTPYYIDGSVAHCIDIMTKTHRVALYRQNFEMVTTISQSDILRYIQTLINEANSGSAQTRRYATQIKKLCGTKLADLGVFHTPQSLGAKSTIWDAIELAGAKNYRVIPIINDAGQIIGDFNVGKLTALGAYYNDKTLNRHAAAVDKNGKDGDYYTQHKQTLLTTATLYDWVTEINPTKAEDVPCIDQDATFEQALGLMLSLKRHHLFCIDENKKPMLIVTMTDLLKVLQPNDVDLEPIAQVKLNQLWK